MDIKELVEYADEGELTPRFMKAIIGFTIVFLVLGGILAYIVTFVILGF
jgi:hypothetical protein